MKLKQTHSWGREFLIRVDWQIWMVSKMYYLWYFYAAKMSFYYVLIKTKWKGEIVIPSMSSFQLPLHFLILHPNDLGKQLHKRNPMLHVTGKSSAVKRQLCQTSWQIKTITESSALSAPCCTAFFILLLTCSSLMRSLILAVASSWARNRLITLARSGSKIFPSSSRTTWSSSRILYWEKWGLWRLKQRHTKDNEGWWEEEWDRVDTGYSRHTCCHSQSWRWLSAWAL